MSKFDDLIKLQQMLEEGLLSQPEFEQFKQELLASAESADATSVSHDDYFVDLSSGGADGAKAPAEAVQPNPPKRKYLTKGEWFLAITGWVLMSVGFYLTFILGIILIGAWDTAGMGSQVLCWVTASMLFVGAQLSSIGWLLGVDRGFGGVRTVVFVITVVLVYMSIVVLGGYCSMLSARP